MGELLVTFIVYILEALMAWQYFDNIFVSRFDKRLKGSFIIIGYSVMFLFWLADIFWLNYLIFACINGILVFVLYYSDIKKSIFYSMIMTAIMAITEFIVAIILARIYGDFQAYRQNTETMVIMSVLCKILYYLFLQFAAKIFSRSNKEKYKSSRLIVFLCLIPAISVFVTAVFLIIGFENAIPDKLICLVIGAGVMMLAMNVVVFQVYFYGQKLNIQFTSAQLQLQKEHEDTKYYQLMAEQSENQKILLHDMKKHLYTIADLLDEKSDADAKGYIETLINSKSLNHEIRLCTNPTLNLILSRYMEVCKKEHVIFDIDVYGDCLDFIQIGDMSALFGNLLDNALEAARGTQDAFIEVRVKKSEEGQTLISVINSCREIPVKTSNGQFVSNKQDSEYHGYGTKSIRKVVKKYGGEEVAYYREDDHTFHVGINFTKRS